GAGAAQASPGGGGARAPAQPAQLVPRPAAARPLQEKPALYQRAAGIEHRPVHRVRRLAAGRGRRLHHGAGAGLSAARSGQCGNRHLAGAGGGDDGRHHGAACGAEPECRHHARLLPHGGGHGGRPVRRRRRQASARRAIAAPLGAAGAGRRHPLRALAGADPGRYVQLGRDRHAMTRLLVLVALIFASTAPAFAERLISGVSTESIQVTSSFDGERLTFFGTIAPDTGSEQRYVEGPFQVVVAVLGPYQDRVAREMTNNFGIWLNTEQVEFRHFPSYFHVLSSGRLLDRKSVV